MDCANQFTVTISPQLLNGEYNVVDIETSAHREPSMRNDIAPSTSNWVRQAVARTLDRPAIVTALFKGKADIGNDNPFAPVFPQTDKSIPQRHQDLKLARHLLAKGGVPRGFYTPLLTEKLQEMPDFAQIVKESAAKIGVDIKLSITSSTQYYGQAMFGKSPWLDGEMSLVDCGSRPVPDRFLEAPLQTINAKTGAGAWYAARLNDPTYDKLANEYIAAVDLPTQRKLAGQIETLLLEQTPIIYAYFYDYLAASQKDVHGIYPQAGGQFFSNNVTES